MSATARSCHPKSNADYVHQQFKHDQRTGSLHTLPGVAGGACLTLDRSQPPPPGTLDPWGEGETAGRWKTRLNDMCECKRSFPAFCCVSKVLTA